MNQTMDNLIKQNTEFQNLNNLTQPINTKLINTSNLIAKSGLFNNLDKFINDIKLEAISKCDLPVTAVSSTKCDLSNIKSKYEPSASKHKSIYSNKIVKQCTQNTTRKMKQNAKVQIIKQKFYKKNKNQLIIENFDTLKNTAYSAQFNCFKYNQNTMMHIASFKSTAIDYHKYHWYRNNFIHTQGKQSNSHIDQNNNNDFSNNNIFDNNDDTFDNKKHFIHTFTNKKSLTSKKSKIAPNKEMQNVLDHDNERKYFQAPFENLKEHLKEESYLTQISVAIIMQAMIDCTAHGNGKNTKKIRKNAREWIFNNGIEFRKTCVEAKILPEFVINKTKELIGLNDPTKPSNQNLDITIKSNEEKIHKAIKQVNIN